MTLIKPERGLKEKVALNREDLKWVMHEKIDFHTHTINKKNEFLLEVPQQSDSHLYIWLICVISTVEEELQDGV